MIKNAWCVDENWRICEWIRNVCVCVCVSREKWYVEGMVFRRIVYTPSPPSPHVLYVFTYHTHTTRIPAYIFLVSPSFAIIARRSRMHTGYYIRAREKTPRRKLQFSSWTWTKWNLWESLIVIKVNLCDHSTFQLVLSYFTSIRRSYVLRPWNDSQIYYCWQQR